MFDRSFGLWGRFGTLSGPTTPLWGSLPLGTNMLVVGRAARALPLLAALSRPQSFLRSGFAPFACAAAATSSSSVSDLLAAWLDKALTAEARKRKALQKEADAARSAERLGQWATLVVANLYRIDPAAERAIVEDWENGGTPTELKFDPSEGTPREQADKAFAKARKLRRGSAVVAELIEQSEATERKLRAWRQRLDVSAAEADAVNDETLRKLRSDITREAKKLQLKLPEHGFAAEGDRSAAADKSKSLPRGSRADTQPQQLFASQTGRWSGREFASPMGVPILVGRNRAENEQLSLKIARDPDVWFHVRGAPGAHVVLRMSQLPKGSVADDDCMQMAADLAAFYSELRDERKALVAYTSPRHITKPNGAPLGAVRLREEDGTILGRPTDSALIPKSIVELRERETRGGGALSGGNGYS